MKLYSATVNLAGAITNQVIVSQVTASEIAVLQRIHGDDAVRHVVEVGQVKGRSDARERARLATLYPKGLAADGKAQIEGAAFINSIFGVGTPLPAEYVEPEIEEKAEEIEMAPEADEQIEIAEKPTPIKRTKLPPKKATEAVDLVA